MRKILSISLMLSMAISLMACSTEPVSNVSGELSEGVGVSNVDTSNLSIFGMDKEDLTVEQLETYNALIDILWVSSFMKEEGMDDTFDYFGTTLDFHEDGTVVVVEDGVTKNGTWTSEWGTTLDNGVESERAKIDVSFDDNTFLMLLEPNDYDNVPFYNDELEMWFNKSGNTAEYMSDEENENYDLLINTDWVSERVSENRSGNYVNYNYNVDFREDGTIQMDKDGEVLEGTWDNLSSWSTHEIYLVVKFDDVEYYGYIGDGYIGADNQAVDLKYLALGIEDELHIEFPASINEEKVLTNTIWTSAGAVYLDVAAQSKKLGEILFRFNSGTQAEFVLEDGTTYAITLDRDLSDIIYTDQYSVDLEFNMTSDFFSEYSSGAEHTVNATINNLGLTINSAMRVFQFYNTGWAEVDGSKYLLNGTVWQLSALQDKNGTTTDLPGSLSFEFISGTEGLLSQPNDFDTVTLSKDISDITINSLSNLSNIDEEFALNGAFFERYNSDGGDMADIKILNEKLTITTENQTFIFDYSGTRPKNVKQDMMFTLNVLYDEHITEAYDLSSRYTVFEISENKLTLMLNSDGTAELSDGSQTIISNWDFNNVQLGNGEDFGYININSDIFDIDKNSDFFADLIDEAKRIDERFEATTNDGAIMYPGNLTHGGIWFDLGETRFEFVVDDYFNIYDYFE